MKSMLIVEDNEAYQRILKDFFISQKFDVTVVNTAKEAMFSVSRSKPDIILLDIMLPGGSNGFDFLEQLKALDSTKHIPVIIITNLGDQEDLAHDVGAQLYFVKSGTTIDNIFEGVNRLLGQM